MITHGSRLSGAGLLRVEIAVRDWDLWARLAHKGEILIVQDHLVIYHNDDRDRISTRHRDVYSGYRKMYFRYKHSMQQDCRDRHLDYLLHLRYKIATTWAGRFRCLSREARLGAGKLLAVDVLNYVLPARIFRFIRHLCGRMGLLGGF